MKTFVWSCAAILVLVVSAQSLMCYSCDTSILGYCATSQKINCSVAQTSCYSGVASLTGIAETLHSKGCIEPGSCGNSITPLFNNTNANLTVSTLCCTTNLCNRAGPGRAPLALGSALGALLLALGMNFDFGP